MEYILIAKCDVCGNSFCWESKRNDYICQIAIDKLGFRHQEGKMMCESCYERYQALKKTHSQELGTFLKGT